MSVCVFVPTIFEMRLSLIALSLSPWIACLATAQTNQQSAPIYRVTVVQRSLDAVNFERHGVPTQVDLRGTVLMPKLEGSAAVEVKNGYTKIDANMKHVTAANQFGSEFLTYVLWAISPDGRATNLGEVLPNGSDKVSMHVSAPYSTFGLIVTAEPYFSVQYPSDVAVAESAVRADTVGRVEQVHAKYELLPHGQYTLNIPAAQLSSSTMQSQQQKPLSLDQYEALLELYQARNAMQIAKADGAGKEAVDVIGRAQSYLAQAEASYQQKKFKDVTNSARQAVQAASDARTIAMRRKAEGPQQPQRVQ